MGEAIDGKKIAQDIMGRLQLEVAELKKHGVRPSLAVLLNTENPPSVVYVRKKEEACAQLGITSTVLRYDSGIRQKRLEALISELNSDQKVNGVLLQLPVPKHLDEAAALNAIAPLKDVDGLTARGKAHYTPCTALAVEEILKATTPLIGRMVIVGRSKLVGMPLALIMYDYPLLTVTVCHTGTSNIWQYTKEADILVAAAGVPGFITADMVKQGAVVIDVGTNSIKDESKKSGYRLVGDVRFEETKEKSYRITPVPGGVGLVTVASLMVNTVCAARLQMDTQLAGYG